MTLIEDIKPKENITTSGTKTVGYISTGEPKEGDLPKGVIRGKDGKLHLDYRPIVTTINRSQVSNVGPAEPDRSPKVRQGKPLFKDERRE